MLFGRGPFDRQAETELLAREKVDVLVSKNSGGKATYAKIAAARELGITVVMIARPDKPHGYPLQNASEAIRDALRVLQQKRREDALKLRALRAQIKAGLEALDRGDFAQVADVDLDDYLENLTARPGKGAH